MQSELIYVLAFCLVVYALLSRPLGSSIISGPTFFMLSGMLVGPAGLKLIHIDIDDGVLELFAEFTLGLILFADAATTDTRKLFRNPGLPERLLLIALPLTIGLGTIFALIMFPGLTWPQAGLIAAILAPTDAALGLAVVKSTKVPERLRRAILVESGLNDGLALAAVLFFAALSFSMSGETDMKTTQWLWFALSQIGIGIVTGLALGGLCGWLVSRANEIGFIDHNFKGLIAIAVAVLSLISAEHIGGNSFIAAFVAGLVFGRLQKAEAEHLIEFIEEEGQLLSLIVFFLFGAVLLPHAYEYFTVFCFLYAIFSLTVIRMVPTIIAMSKSGTQMEDKLFVGWFGPRGLASILFLLIAVEHSEGIELPRVEAVVYITVFLSVILHGASANYLSGWIEKRQPS